MNGISILDFGASANGELCTKALQAALDEANGRKNATVVVPCGDYVTGTVNLGSASLYLEKGAVLKGSPCLGDYSTCGYRHNEMGDVLPLLYSMNGEGITISGEGTIDLNGDAFFDFDRPSVPRSGRGLTPEQVLECTVPTTGRPNQPIFFHQCRNIVVKGVKIINSPCWTFTFNDCETVRMLDLTIDNNLRIPNNDGMHFCCSRDILIRGCVISSGDDCIALSSITDWNKFCEGVVISDCILTSCSKAIVAGYMHSLVRNVCISNVIIRRSNRGLCIMSSERTGLVENVTVSNVLIDTRVRAGNWWGNGEPILIMATWHHNPGYDMPPPDRCFDANVRNIHVQSAICSSENAIGIVGANGNVCGVTISGLSMQLKDSENKGIKGNRVDLSPSDAGGALPEDGNDYWLLVEQAEDIVITNPRITDYHGRKPLACIRGTQACRIE